MNNQEVMDFIKAHNHCFLGTLDGDQPRVRGVHLYISEKDELMVHTGKMKDLYSQLQSAEKVEICCVDFQNMIQVRVSGISQEEEDLRVKHQIVEERPYLKPFVEQGSIHGLGVFRITRPKATVWTMNTNLDKKELITL
ncbi:MAG: pyridoxamine 5'-phosphate oxidase family protein [Spirochaetota bacterium]|nr:pyridoxamine 5'-phosphate oxidase family protein [Spirochaetota bacterium]